MPIRFSCKCGKKYSVRDELAGRTARCGRCGASLIIPKLTAPKQESHAPVEIYSLADSDFPEPHRTGKPPATALQPGATVLSNHIIINGQTFANVQDMPPELRRQYDSFMQLLNNSGALASAQRELNISTHQSAPFPGVSRTTSQRTIRRYFVNDREYRNFDDLPPKVRAAFAITASRPIAPRSKSPRS
jgi:hypothetical protein